MLVLTRYNGESIVIDERVVVTVAAIMRDNGRRIHDAKVRLLFDAPDDVVIDRLEIHERKRDDGGKSRNPGS